MPSSISRFLANGLLDHVFGGNTYAPLPTIYLALLATAPISYFDGGGEVEEAGVSRLAIVNDATAFPASTTIGLSTVKTNGIPLDFGTASSTLASVAFGFYDAAVGGSWLGGGSFTVPLSFASGVNVVIPSEAIAIAFNAASAGSCSGYLCRSLLNFAFGAVDYLSPPTFAAYFTTAPNYTTGNGAVEPSGGGYSRIAARRINGALNGTFSNGAEDITISFPFSLAFVIPFPPPTGSQGTVIAGGLFDAISGGNLLCGGDFVTSLTLVSGNSGVRFAVNSIQVKILSIA